MPNTKRNIKKNHLLLVIILAVVLMMTFLPFFQGLADSSLTAQQQQQQDQALQLQQQLKDIENQISQYEQQLSVVKSQKNTLNNKIQQLKVQQAKIVLQIKETNIEIQNTQTQIDQTQGNIDQNNKKLDDLKNQISVAMQSIYEQERYPLVEVLFVPNGLSQFYSELNNFDQLNKNLSDLAQQVKVETANLQSAEQQLNDQQDQQKNFVAIINIQNQQLNQTISDQNQLLQETKGRESSYQTMLNDKKQQAAQIQNRIYQLLGVGSQITFGQAVAIAQSASALTGVRAAFLLAILTQESNLGKNVGTCNRPGDPPSKSWRVIMKPDRDQQPFIQITGDLGRNPDITPVSCPMHAADGSQIGWGGAMGPAQFIPSTWMGYRDQVAAISGAAADPWDIRDAFIAAAIKLKAGGAGSQSGEWAAAMQYFSGSTNPRFRFYGDNVVAMAAKYQNDINTLGS